MTTSAATKAAPRVTNLRPMLAVTDLPASVRFYVEKLGFNCSAMHGNPPVWAEVERDGVALMLNAPPVECVRKDVPRSCKNYQIFYFNVAGVEDVHREFRSRGVAASELRVAFYQMKEFEVRDPDDYWLWFAEATNEPPTQRED
ncbi:MAG: VOC family protein [Phycisphaerales bacterium]